MNCGTNHYQRLMAQFGTVVDVFLGLDEGAQVRRPAAGSNCLARN